MTEPRQARTAASDELLSVADVCDELGITRATFNRWRARRKGPEAGASGSVALRLTDSSQLAKPAAADLSLTGPADVVRPPGRLCTTRTAARSTT